MMGGCVCVEVYDPAVLKGYQEYAYKRGVFSRPFLNYLYAMVPYIIKEEELVHDRGGECRNRSKAGIVHRQEFSELKIPLLGTHV